MKYSILFLGLTAALGLNACVGPQGATGVQGPTGRTGQTGGDTVIVTPVRPALVTPVIQSKSGWWSDGNYYYQ